MDNEGHVTTFRGGGNGCTRITEIVSAGACIGCGGCAVASHGAYEIKFGKSGMYQSVRSGQPSARVDEAAVSAVCPFSNIAENEDEIAARVFPGAPNSHSAVGVWHAAYVGWVNEGNFRVKGSSGGMVSWLLTELLRRGEIDGAIHIVPHAPTATDRSLFNYRLSRTVQEIKGGAKSRYYPIEFSSVLQEVRNNPGRYAFVGVPCMVKAMRLLMKSDEVIQSRIKVCVGLFCGHLKSAALVDSFARQAGLRPRRCRRLISDSNNPDRRADVYTVNLTSRDGSVRHRDWGEMVDGDWGMGFFQYSACNYCETSWLKRRMFPSATLGCRLIHRTVVGRT